jgi:hypothetical protein
LLAPPQNEVVVCSWRGRASIRSGTHIVGEPASAAGCRGG